MAENVTYSRIVELLDNTQYLAALKKAEAEEQVQTALRVAGGQAAVKALKDVEREQANAAKEAARLAAKEIAEADKKAAYLQKLRLQSVKDAERAAEKEAKAAERAARGPSAWTLSLQANTKAINEQRGALNQGAEGLGKFTSILGTLDPRLAAMTSGLQQATGAASAIGTGLNAAGASAAAFSAAALPLTAAIAAGAFAWKEYNEYVEAGEEKLKAAREEAQRVTAVFDRLSEAQFTASLDAKVLAGEMTEMEAAQRKAAHGITSDFGPALNDAQRKMDDLKGKIREINETLAKGEMGVDRRQLERDRAQLVDGLESARNEYDQLNATINRLEETTTTNIATTAAKAEADKKAGEAAKVRTSEVKDLTTELEKQAAAEQAFLDGIDAMIAGNEGLSLSATSLALAQQEANAAIDDTIAGVNDYGAAAEKTTAKTLEMTDKQKQALAGVAEAYDIASDAIGAHLDEVLSSRYAKITDLESAIETAEKKGQTARAKGLKQQLAAEKAAAQKAFDQQQTLSAANATVNWLEALVKATTYGPIGGPIVAAAATAAYGFSLKSIESEKPEFTDTPRPVRLGGDRGRDVGGARGAENDSAVFYRDPNQGIAQIVGEAVRRSMPAPPRMSQVAFGLSLGSIGVNRLLTSDLRRANRNQLS